MILEEWLWDKEDGRLFVDLTYHRVYEWIARLGKMLQIQAWLIPEHTNQVKKPKLIYLESQLVRIWLMGFMGRMPNKYQSFKN
jgi:hypothetical protein